MSTLLIASVGSILRAAEASLSRSSVCQTLCAPAPTTSSVPLLSGQHEDSIQGSGDFGNAVIVGTQRFQMRSRAGGDKQPWLQFENAQGDVQGAIVQGDRGATLVSGSGDFAEWRKRADNEKPLCSFYSKDILKSNFNMIPYCTKYIKHNLKNYLRIMTTSLATHIFNSCHIR